MKEKRYEINLIGQNCTLIHRPGTHIYLSASQTLQASSEKGYASAIRTAAMAPSSPKLWPLCGFLMLENRW